MPSQGKSEGFDSCDWPSNLTQIGLKSSINQPCGLEIWWMTSKNNMAPLLYYIKLCASFQIHWWIETGVTVRKCSIRVRIGDFLSRVILKFDRWPWKIIGHLFYTTLSFVQHFKAIGIFKLELQSGNAQFGSKLVIFLSRVTLKIDVWPWKKIGHLFSSILRQALCILSNPLVKSNLSYSLETPKLGKNWPFFCPAWPWKLTYDLTKQ